jgi:hypothetical protein
MITKVLKKKRKISFKDFYTEISKYIPGLENFTRAKIKIAENEAAIEKEFYTVNDILDAVYLQVFETYSEELNKESLPEILFLKTIAKLSEIKKIEKKPKYSISTTSILREELDLLDENYSLDAESDFITQEEFDDISYHQKYFKLKNFILNEVLEDQLIGKVFQKNASFFLSEHRKDIPKVFHNLPTNIETILELYVFGNQDASEISQILGIKTQQINLVINEFLKEFKDKI